MKKIIFAFLILIPFLFSCKGKKQGIPDVSGVKVNMVLKRFDRDLSAVDTNNIAQAVNDLAKRYPDFFPVYVFGVLGIDSASAAGGIHQFISLSKNLFDTVNTVFPNLDWLQKDFQQAFQFVKYYFPSYREPEIITLVGPVNAFGEIDGVEPTPNFSRPSFIGISLQLYLGKNFSVYNDLEFIQREGIPLFRSRRFSKEYIVADAMHLVITNMFPYNSGDRPLIEQMVEKGKRWYVLDKFLPHAPDSVKTGYTALQLEWCNRNEALIWTDFVKNQDLQSLVPDDIQNYLKEGPFTQGYSQEYSPGNLGQWIGWQIVKKYIGKHPDMKIGELMKTDPRKILEEAKYKPR